MENILTEEDKKYLGKVSRYLLSLGMDSGRISMEDVVSTTWDYDELLSWNLTYFDNNWTVEIPPGLIPILNKVFNYVIGEDLIKSSIDKVDPDEISSSYLDIEILSNQSRILVEFVYYYYDVLDSYEETWDYKEEDKDSKQSMDTVFSSLKNHDFDETGIINLDYSGAGDSGYIESSFSDGQMVPQIVEDWCERVLSQQFGAWGDNEGSQGTFTFDTKNKIIYLSHRENIEERDSKTLWEEKF